MRLKQIGVRASVIKNYLLVFLINTVNKNPMKNPANKSQGSSLERKFILLAGYVPRLPIRLNMTFPFSLMFSMQGMIFMFGQQRLFVKQQTYYIIEFVQILAAFFHQLALLLERTGKCWLQHGLIVRVQIRQHFFKRIVPLCRYFPSEHSVAFGKSREGLGVKTLFPCYRIAVRGADRTFPRLVRPLLRSQSKGKNSPAFRHFTRNVNNQPMVSRNVYSLRHGHKESIA